MGLRVKYTQTHTLDNVEIESRVFGSVLYVLCVWFFRFLCRLCEYVEYYDVNIYVVM